MNSPDRLQQQAKLVDLFILLVRTNKQAAQVWAAFPPQSDEPAKVIMEDIMAAIAPVIKSVNQLIYVDDR